MTAPTFFNGQGGSFTLGATTTVVESWTSKNDIEALDTTNTGSAGWQNNINGIEKLEGSLKMFADSTNWQAGTLTPGVTGTITLLLGGSGKSVSGPARLTSVSISNPAKGVVTYDVDFVSNGAWSYST